MVILWKQAINIEDIKTGKYGNVIEQEKMQRKIT